MPPPPYPTLSSRARTEITSLELRISELERVGRAKDAQLSRASSSPSPSPPPPPPPLEASREAPREAAAAAAAARAIDDYLVSRAGLPRLFESLAVKREVSAALGRTLRAYADGGGSSGTRARHHAACLRLARSVLRERETRDDLEACRELWTDVARLYFAPLTTTTTARGGSSDADEDGMAAEEVREEAAKAGNNALFKNTEAREELARGVRALETGAFPLLAKEIADVGNTSDAQATRIWNTLMVVFSSANSVEDKVLAKAMIKAGVMAATVSRLAFAYREAVGFSRDTVVRPHALSHATFEGRNRAMLLETGLRFLYAVAVSGEEEMLGALLANGGKPVLQGEALDSVDLETPDMGVGDEISFLQIRVAVSTATTLPDADALDGVITRLCPLLMMADAAPGFVPFFHKHGGVRGLLRLLGRVLRRAHAAVHGDDANAVAAVAVNQDVLLPLLVVLFKFAEASPEALDDMRDAVCGAGSLLPDLRVEDFGSKEEFERAKEQRHFKGHAKEGTTLFFLVKLLTTFEEHVKRYAGELLWLLCDENADVVTHHCGFGNAAHMLAIKGGMMGQILAQQEERQRQMARQARP